MSISRMRVLAGPNTAALQGYSELDATYNIACTPSVIIPEGDLKGYEPGLCNESRVSFIYL